MADRTKLKVVPIAPSRGWSMPHAVPDPKEPDSERKPSLLGLSMRMCEPEFAVDNVWHVLDVLEGSPAESAGLVPYGDWIIGWSGGVLSAEGDFYEVVESVRLFRVFTFRGTPTEKSCSISKSLSEYTSIRTISSRCFGFYRSAWLMRISLAIFARLCWYRTDIGEAKDSSDVYSGITSYFLSDVAIRLTLLPQFRLVAPNTTAARESRAGRNTPRTHTARG